MRTWWRVIFDKLLGKKGVSSPLDMESIFKGSGATALQAQAYRGYPASLPLDAGIGAYLVRFLVSEGCMERLTLALSQIGYLVLPELDTQVIERSGDHSGKKVMLFLHPSFAGTIVSFASDDLDVLEALQQTRLAPPLPADSFPWIDPEALGSLQGDVEYWWMNFWLPFWVSLNQEEQLALDLEPEWREFIVNHQPTLVTESAG
ncbi:hypothetical protein CVS42_11135 [Aeromonas veronii]|uniref:hypothetical protein n=1 Tax=Aeromonas veronii TaxID=654 RepID=UPI000C288A01|nr:hypothetical protein [Aeromonas veronii]ATY81328.1 hypothetical protein CVS42_11135 [Aeromonas veronii]QLH67119.1 hypothetical protein HXV88_11975 [Aeromonas veronii]